MKNIVSVLIALSITTSVFSQEAKKDFLPKAGQFGTSIVLNGLIDNINFTTTNNTYGQNILFGKYYIQDDLVLRAGFGFNLTKVVKEIADSSGVLLVEEDSLRRSFNLNFSVGIEKHLTTSNRLDPFVFAQIDITAIGKTKIESELREISTVGTGTTNREIIRDGGVAFGLNAGAGFNYFLAKNFSVGSEVFIGLQYVSVGGGVSDNTNITTAGGINSSTFESKEDITKTTNFNVIPQAQINLSYFF